MLNDRKTSKEDYDSSVKEDMKGSKTTESVFQGLRADLDDIGSSRVFIVSFNMQIIIQHRLRLGNSVIIRAMRLPNLPASADMSLRASSPLPNASL